MKIIKILLKVVAVSVMLVTTALQWFGVFIVSISSVVFNLLAGLFFLVGVTSYILGLTAGSEALKMLIVGFVIFMIPVVGERIVAAVTTANVGLREYIKS